MKIKLLVLSILFALLCPVNAHAVTGETGQTLLTACESKTDSQQFAWCVGYIQGHGDGLDGVITTNNKGEHFKISFADGVTVSQCVLVFIKYMHENPEVLNKSADEALGYAMVGKGLMILTKVKTAPQSSEQ